MFIASVFRGFLAVVLLLGFILIINECAVACSSKRTKDIPYIAPDAAGFSAERNRLDVYEPKKKGDVKYPVVVFIHGGGWDSGSKNLYGFIGRRLAKQGVVAVIINYRLAPAVEVPMMADDCARAVLWTQQHIARYGGDPNRIFVMGHSAGGGLAALLAADNRFFSKLGVTQNPVKGAILDDPAGLDMFDYLNKMEYPDDQKYLVPFGKEPAVWRAMSALYHINAGSPPMLVFVGERTYPGIARSTRKLRDRLEELGIKHEFKLLPGKKHIPMVLQLFWKNNVIYRDLLQLVGATSAA